MVLRLSAVIVALSVGYAVALAMGKVDLSGLAELPLVSVPQLFRFGFAFDWMAFIPIAVIFLITPLETAGDLTANSMISRQPGARPAVHAPHQVRHSCRRLPRPPRCSTACR